MRLLFTIRIRFGTHFSFYEDELYRKYYSSPSNTVSIVPCDLVEHSDSCTIFKNRVLAKFQYLNLSPVITTDVKVDFLGRLKYITDEGST
jgi:hypothetical protein